MRDRPRSQRLVFRTGSPHPFLTQSYSSEEYLGLLSTFSDHITLPETQRDALFAEIRKLIDEHGGTIEKPYRSALYMAQVI